MTSKKTVQITAENVLPEGVEVSFAASGYDMNIVTVTVSGNAISIFGRRADDTVITVTKQNSGVMRECIVHTVPAVTDIVFDQFWMYAALLRKLEAVSRPA